MTRALLFPGQGSQYVGMGKGLHDNFKPARETYEEACDALHTDIATLSFTGPAEELNILTTNAQPAILTHSLAAWRVLTKESELFHASNGFMAAGHSLGEFSALTAAGVFKFQDAVTLVRDRGRYMQEACAPGVGSMAAVMGLTADEVLSVCQGLSTHDQVVVAANFNAETQIVISGHSEAIQKAVPVLKEKGGRVIPLAVSVPSHSPLMESAADRLKQDLYSLPVATPAFPYIANVDAFLYDTHTTAVTIRDNLVKQLYSPLRWFETIQTIHKLGGLEAVIEIGPGKVLSGLYKKTFRDSTVITIDTDDDMKRFLQGGAA